MLKHISLIALVACSFTSVASAQSENPTVFTFDYSLWSGVTTSDGVWHPSSEFRNSNSYFYTVVGADNATTTDVSITWDSNSGSRYSDNLINFNQSANKSSTVTFDFGTEVTDISFVVYGLQGTNSTTPGKFRIEGVDGADIEDYFNGPNMEELTAASGYGTYERTTAQNQNGSPAVSVTILAPVTSLTLYFESQNYQISSLMFSGTGGAPMPEPGTYALLLGAGIAGVVVLRRRRKAKA